MSVGRALGVVRTLEPHGVLRLGRGVTAICIAVECLILDWGTHACILTWFINWRPMTYEFKTVHEH